MLAVDRVAAVLSSLANGATSLPQVCEASNLPKSTASRLLSALEEHELVYKATDGSIALGAAVERMAARPPAVGRLIDAARASMRSLCDATGEAVCLSVIDNGETHTVFQVDTDTPKAVRAQDWVDRRWPIRETGSAMSILSTWSPAEVKAVTDTLPQRHRKTIDAAVIAARSEPTSWSADNYVDGLTSVAAPILNGHGRATSALIIYGPSYRFPEPKSPKKIEKLLATSAAAIAKDLY